MWRRSGALSALLAAALLASPALPQTIAASVQALAEAKRQAKAADARSAALEKQSRQATDEATRTRAQEAAVAARIQSAEADIAAGEARVRIVADLRARQRARLAAKQGPIVRLAAALQTMARRPPALALVQPGTLADVAHVRALLGSQLPLVQARTAGLRAEVAEGTRLAHEADAAVATLRAGRARLDAERGRLAQLEARHRMRAQAYTDSAMYEQDRAIALGEKARDIVELMGDLGRQAEVRDRLASLPGPVLRPAVPGATVAPAPLAAAQATPRLGYRLPVLGRLATGFGEVSEAGVRARGLTIATSPRAQVVAPAPGRVSYAAPFRDYGQIVILDHGNGWTTLLTGLGGLAVRVGDTLDAGSPIGHAGDQGRVTVELRRGGTPIDIAAMGAS